MSAGTDRPWLMSSDFYRECVVGMADTLITSCGSQGNYTQAVTMGHAPAATFAYDPSTIAKAHQLLRQARHLLAHAPLHAQAQTGEKPDARAVRTPPVGWRVIEGQRPGGAR